MTLPRRIDEKIDRSGSCWIWIGAINPTGYGAVWMDGHARRSHRVVYELLVGPIPEGLDLDHLCRVRSCCNPDHLEPVTRRENLLRGNPDVQRALATHCARGHEFNASNTYVTPTGGRRCRTCVRLRRRSVG